MRNKNRDEKISKSLLSFIDDLLITEYLKRKAIQRINELT
jgi:hypothetical protein